MLQFPHRSALPAHCGTHRRQVGEAVPVQRMLPSAARTCGTDTVDESLPGMHCSTHRRQVGEAVPVHRTLPSAARTCGTDTVDENLPGMHCSTHQRQVEETVPVQRTLPSAARTCITGPVDESLPGMHHGPMVPHISPAFPLYKVKEPSHIHGYRTTVRQDIPLLPAPPGRRASGGGRDPGDLCPLLRGRAPGDGARPALAVHRGQEPVHRPAPPPAHGAPPGGTARPRRSGQRPHRPGPAAGRRRPSGGGTGAHIDALCKPRACVRAALETLRRALEEDEP